MSHFIANAFKNRRLVYSLSGCALFVLLLAGASYAQDQMRTINKTTEIAPPQIVRLWDGDAPGTMANAGAETINEKGIVTNVSVPTLSVYLPPKAVATGAAILVCSGGGYSKLAVQKHGEGSAQTFLPRGIAVLALKYRTAPPAPAAMPLAVADAERAIRLARSRARDWNLDPNRIGILGHSAGANLILNLLTQYDAGDKNSADLVERQSSRPAFAALMAAWPNGQKVEDFQFLSDAPPVFLCSARDDSSAPTAFTLAIAEKLKDNGTSAQTEIFQSGGHEAFTVGQGAHGADWPPIFLNWLAIVEYKKFTVVVFGDSITAGNATALQDKSRLWLRQIEAGSDGKLALLNRGKGGRPTNSVGDLEKVLGENLNPDLLVIALGGNDARDISDSSVPRAVANIRAMIDKARAKYSEKFPILLVGPTNVAVEYLGPTKPIGPQRSAKDRELNQAFEQLARENGCDFVSLYDAVPTAFLTTDGVHPDDKGNDLIAAVMKAAIQKALAKSRS